MPNTELLRKIESRKARVCVIGLGYVGLPLAVAFAEKGFPVTGLDIDVKKIASLRKGISYIQDVPSSRVKPLVSGRHFKAMSDYSILSQQDIVIICVPTPLSKTKEPDISYVLDATEKIAKHLKKSQLIVLESTTYPGTTEETMLPVLVGNGLKPEKDFFLAFSPERVDPGNKRFETTNIPKVVGGIGPHSSEAAKFLYESIIQSIVPVSSPRTAEMVKLLENTFRSVNIGLINEMALLCRNLGVDIWEVIEAAKTKPFGFMPFYPGPGIGGHCLPVDPLYLSWKSRAHGFEAKLIELAAEINQSMPQYVAQRMAELLNDRQISLKNAAILVLGVSYKKDVQDMRESPALDVLEHLIKAGANVRFADPYNPKIIIGKKMLSRSVLTPALLKKQQAVVLLTDHSNFDYKMILNYSRLILDTRNALRKFAPKPHLYFL